MKAPGKKPRAVQLREHELLRLHGGCEVVVLDSREAIDRCLEELCAISRVHTNN